MFETGPACAVERPLGKLGAGSSRRDASGVAPQGEGLCEDGARLGSCDPARRPGSAEADWETRAQARIGIAPFQSVALEFVGRQLSQRNAAPSGEY
jgi:hypothetical protein